MSTATLEPAVKPEHVEEPHSPAVTPGTVVLRDGGKATAKPDPKKKSSSSSKRSTAKKATTSGAKKSTAKKSTTASAGTTGRVSAIKAAERVLGRAHEPLHVKEITKRILSMPDTNLKGKTPEASVGAILAVAAKKRDSVFKRTAPSTYTLKGKK